ncbi:hypothetical protein QP028_08695 [Corynebacterium suedekumii]|nr:hypothetical protein QP028_08695 [Corynebacterium suedekumii]
MSPRPARVPHYLFVNENIGGHRTVHRSLRSILAERDDVTVEFIDGEDPGLLGRILRAPVPLLSRLDLDLQPLRGQLVHSWNMRRRVRRRLARGGWTPCTSTPRTACSVEPTCSVPCRRSSPPTAPGGSTRSASPTAPRRGPPGR